MPAILAGRCSTADAEDHMRPSKHTDSELSDISSPMPPVADAYNFYLDAEGNCDLADVLSSGEIYIILSLRADFTVIRSNFVESSVETSTTAAGVFSWVLLVLTTLGEQGELLASVYWFCSTIWSSEAQLTSLWSQISSQPAEVEAVRSEAGQREASFEAASFPLSAYHTTLL